MFHVIDYIKRHGFLIFLIVVAFVAHMVVVFPSGGRYCVDNQCGIFFWGAHSHDAIWHFAITAVSFTQFPFIAPTFSGALLSGYNYLIDIILFLFFKIGISPLITYFKIIPVVWFIGMVVTGVLLARKIKDSPIFVGFYLFFIFFGGSFSYLITLYRNGTIFDSSLLLSMQAAQTLTNPQFALSLILIQALLLTIFDKTYSLKKSVYIGVLLAALIGLKFYGGVIGISIAGLYIIEAAFRLRNALLKSLHLLAIPILALVSLLLFYDPFGSGGVNSGLVFDPLATVHPIIEDRGLVHMPTTVLARYFLQEHGVGPRLILIELMTVGIFLFLNLGTRAVAFGYFLMQITRRSFERIDGYIYFGISVSLFLAMFFIQKGMWWNTVQFLYYALFLLSIPTAKTLFGLWKSKVKLARLIVIVIMAITLPTTIDVLKGFTAHGGHGYISDKEMAALDALEKMPNGVVFTYQYEYKEMKPENPQPLYKQNNSAYVTAFSNKQLYLGDKVQLELTGVNFDKRLERLMKNDCAVSQEITYVYRIKEMPSNFISECILGKFPIVYTNDEVEIYKTK